MKILKFGGTSVGSPERMTEVSNIITDGEEKIVVLSAVSGTTNKLSAICDAMYADKVAEAKEQVETLYTYYIPFVETLLKKDEFREKGITVINNQFATIRNCVGEEFSVKEERIILAQGELISTQLFTLFLHEKGIKATLIPALDFMRTNRDEEPDIPQIEKLLGKTLHETTGNKTYITQGYICKNIDGEIDNLKRGGSDYTASLIGAAADATEVQIWTDIDGMHNNDPRIVDKTEPISELTFDEAAELAYFGAKILHPYTIRPVREKGIPVCLKNTMDPDAKGTVISNNTVDRDIKAIAAKDNITAVKVKSGRMLLAYGFMRQLFEVFEKHKTPIDMVTTSEVAVSLTIDDDSSLTDIQTELEQFGHVEIDKDQTIVCIVGQFVAENKGIISKVFDALVDIPIRMISYGGSKNNISILINMEDKERTLKTLNKELFSFS
ncbi:MAG: aspartate kinase [Cyclobacteriaceae bacterium]